MREPGKAGVPAIAKAARVLRCLAATRSPMTAAAVARACGISPSSCLIILRELVAARFVTSDSATKTYQLGLGLLEITTVMHGRNQSELIRPLLRSLAGEFDALVALWELREDRFVLVDRVHGNGAVRIEMRIGQRIPALAGAIGRSYAAAVDLPVPALKAGFNKLRWQHPMPFNAYLEGVEQARRDGFGLDLGHYNVGINGVAAVVVDQEGRPRFGIASLTIRGVLSDSQLQAFGERIRDTATTIARALYGVHA